MPASIHRLSIASLVVLLVAGCASTGGTAPDVAAAKSAGDAASASHDAGGEPVSKQTAPMGQSDISPLVQPGQNPAVAGPGVDIRATPPGFSPLPTELQARVEERWKLLIDGKGEQAYDFLTPGVRSTLARDAYGDEMRSRPVKWLSAEALDGECEATSCAARVLISFQFRMPATGAGDIKSQSALTERWVKLGDTWSHLPEKYLEGLAK